MNISVLVVSNNEIIAANKNDVLPLILSQLHKNGFTVNEVSNIKVDYHIILSELTKALNDDIVFLIAENQPEASFLSKKAVAKILNEEVVVNQFAKNSIENYFKVNNLPFTKEGNTESFFPLSARCIINTYGVMQGFLSEANKKLLFFLPLEPLELKNMFISSVLPYLLEKFGKNEKTYVFKTFGLTKQELFSMLRDYRKNKHKINIICNEKFLDGEVIIENNPKIKPEDTENLVRNVFSRISGYIYAENDNSLTERARDLLQLNKLTLTIAEDLTAGNITTNFYKDNEDAGDYLYESYITITDESKMKILGVEKDTLIRTNNYSNEVAYEMALGALENARTDVVLSTTGCLNVKSKDYGKCSICVGNINGIHVFNHTFSGDRQKIIQKATNAAFYHLIKKLKQNDFTLGRIKI